MYDGVYKFEAMLILETLRDNYFLKSAAVTGLLATLRADKDIKAPCKGTVLLLRF